MAGRTRAVSIPIDGEQYDVVVCPWCRGPAPVFADKRGNPFARCSQCGCRMFGNMAAMKLGVEMGHVLTGVTWPPTGV